VKEAGSRGTRGTRGQGDKGTREKGKKGKREKGNEEGLKDRKSGNLKTECDIDNGGERMLCAMRSLRRVIKNSRGWTGESVAFPRAA
jgi:hypothetical protein